MHVHPHPHLYESNDESWMADRGQPEKKGKKSGPLGDAGEEDDALHAAVNEEVVERPPVSPSRVVGLARACVKRGVFVRWVGQSRQSGPPLPMHPPPGPNPTHTHAHTHTPTRDSQVPVREGVPRQVGEVAVDLALPQRHRLVHRRPQLLGWFGLVWRGGLAWLFNVW